MSWLYSQALVEEYLGENFLDGEQSAPLNGKPTPQAYCAPDKMTAFSRLSRFGMMFKPLTANLGEELLMSYLADFHAKTSALQEMVMDLMENDQECGEKWHGLLAKYDPDSHSWRTVQCSLLEDLNESLQTLPQWGMTVGGELYLLPMLVQSTNENEFGLSLVPTPTSSTGGANHNSPSNIGGKALHHEPSGICPTEPHKANVGNTQSPRLAPCFEGQEQGESWRASIGSAQWWQIEPPVDRVVDGMVDRVDRLKAIGNGQVPLCAATAWRILTER
jgi:hypothetical protein